MKAFTKQLLQCLMISMLLSKSAASFTPRSRGKEKGKEIVGTSVSFEADTDAGPGPGSELYRETKGRATVGTNASYEARAHPGDDSKFSQMIEITHGLHTEEEEHNILEGSDEQRRAAFMKSAIRIMDQLSTNLDEEIDNQKKRLNGEPHWTPCRSVWKSLSKWDIEIRNFRKNMPAEAKRYYDNRFDSLDARMRILRSMMTTLTQGEKETNQKSFLEGTVFAGQSSSTGSRDGKRNRNKRRKNKPGRKRH